MRGLGELDRIRQQVHQHLPYHRAIAAGRGERFEATFNIALGGCALELVENRPGQLVHIDYRRRHLIAPQPGESQQIVDQLPHSFRAPGD